MSQSTWIAKAGDAAHTGGTNCSGHHQPPRTDDPDALLALIREHISQGRILQAREVAARGTERFPGHAELANANRVLSVGKATPHPGTEPSTDEEFEWLRNPPAWAYGKWVALVGREAVAVADTLAEVMETIRSADLPKKPLVHRIA